MKLFKSELFWGIVAVVLGTFLFLLGCFAGGNKEQFSGAFFIAIGIFAIDLYVSEKKKSS